MPSQFAVSVRTENENCSMHILYVCLWPVACGVWNHVNLYVALSPDTNRNLHVCKCVRVWVPEHLSARVSSCICVCKWLFLFMCVSKGYGDTVKCCPPTLPFGLGFLEPLRPVRLRLGWPDTTEPMACAACQSGTVHTALRTTPSCGNNLRRFQKRVPVLALAVRAQTPSSLPLPSKYALLLSSGLRRWCSHTHNEGIRIGWREKGRGGTGGVSVQVQHAFLQTMQHPRSMPSAIKNQIRTNSKQV